MSGSVDEWEREGAQGSSFGHRKSGGLRWVVRDRSARLLQDIRAPTHTSLNNLAEREIYSWYTRLPCIVNSLSLIISLICYLNSV